MPNLSPGGKRPAIYNVLRNAARDTDALPAYAQSLAEVPVPQTAMRRANQTAVNRLLTSTLDWLASLPPNVRPLALATKFPRVANRVAKEWSEPSACRRDFDDLVYDKRRTRRGFPPDVYIELLALRDFYYGYELRFA